MNKSYDNTLDAILVGVDLMSLPGRELDLLPELLGVKRSHPNKVLGTTELAPQEETGGELQQGGSACQGRTLCIDINAVKCLKAPSTELDSCALILMLLLYFCHIVHVPLMCTFVFVLVRSKVGFN